MKGFFLSVCFCTCSIVGGVIGAGFITGAEIARFFPSYTILPCCFFLFVLMFLSLFGMMTAGALYGEKQTNLRVLGGIHKIYDPLIIGVSFVSVVSMCAGIDNLFSSLAGTNEYLPVLSVPLLIASYFICKKGVDGVGAFNLALVPVMILCILPLGIGVNFSEIQNHPVSFKEMTEIIIYCGLNCFTSAPLLFKQGEKYGLKASALGAAIASLIVSVCVGVVCYRISYYGKTGAMPIMHSLAGSRFYYAVFAFITALGIVTTLVCSHFALVSYANKYPVKRTLNGVIIILAIGVSRLGFQSIINYAYPLVGLIGALYSARTAVVAFKKLFLPVSDLSLGKADERVHTRGKNAKRKRGSVHKVKPEYLPAVNDKVADARLGNKVLAHDRTNPA